MEVVNRHHRPKDAPGRYIGRGTPWGNPFPVEEGDVPGTAAQKFREYAARKLAQHDPVFTKAVLELKQGDILVCSCKEKPGQTPRACHGDTFVEIHEFIKKEGNAKKGFRAFAKANGFPYGPGTDGVDHINVYSKGKTELGRALTNFSPFAVSVPGDGDFASIEGYWYWLSTGRQHDALRDLVGIDAKKLGKTLTKVPLSDFKEKIGEALIRRFDKYPYLRRTFALSTLPFTHYYCWGNDDNAVVYTDHDWIVEALEAYRKELKARWRRCIIAGSRGFDDKVLLRDAIKQSGFDITEIVSGMEPTGADAAGESYAADEVLPVAPFPAKWDDLNAPGAKIKTNLAGKPYNALAGFLRNEAMGKYADCAIIMNVDHSPGSTDMEKRMRAQGKPVFVVHLTRTPNGYEVVSTTF